MVTQIARQRKSKNLFWEPWDIKLLRFDQSACNPFLNDFLGLKRDLAEAEHSLTS